MVKQFFIILNICIGLIATPIFSQKPVTIKLDNPSFEDYPQAAHTPQGWNDCGFPGESPPDVQPNATFRVTKTASHGNTYLGLVVRDVQTWEAIGQRLKTPLLKGVNYTFSLDLARSELYESQSQATKKNVNYITPVIVRIWAGSGYCTKTEMLDETEAISSNNWNRHTFKFTPRATHTHFMIEAYYKIPTLFPYNGNILIDNAGDIVPEEDKKLAVAEVKKPPVKIPKPPVKTPRPPKPTDTPTIVASVKPPKETPKSVETQEPKGNESGTPKNDKPAVGQIIKIERLQFKPTSTVIESDSYPQLDKIYNVLAANPTWVVEIGGHTNLIVDEEIGLKLSRDRAKSVADYLATKGIERNRLVVKGYGKNRPLINETSTRANSENQRVEIKILSING